MIFGYILARSVLLFPPILSTLQKSVMSTCVNPGLFSVAYVTVPSEEVGKKISRALIDKNLAACVNIIPKVTSIYKWNGAVQEDSELILMIKTKTSMVESLTEYVRENHPYEVCEVIAVPISSGNEPYLKWIEESVQK